MLGAYFAFGFLSLAASATAYVRQGGLDKATPVRPKELETVRASELVTLGKLELRAKSIREATRLRKHATTTVALIDAFGIEAYKAYINDRANRGDSWFTDGGAGSLTGDGIPNVLHYNTGYGVGVS